MVAFLAHVDARNAGAVVFSTLERGAAVVKQIMLEQLQSAETDAHILKASQVRLRNYHYLYQCYKKRYKGVVRKM
jgi:Tat protein secretion system quality control protein TatD with DNase activity